VRGNMAKMNVWELLFKIATILRLPRYGVMDDCLAYDKKLIEEILAEINLILDKRE